MSPVRVATIAGVTVGVVLFVIGLSRGPTLDAAVFLTVARTITDGGMPYVDAWDHKPPGIYLVEASVAWLPVDAWGRAWLVSVLASTAALVLVVRSVARARTDDRLVLAIVAVGGAFVVAGHYFARGGGLAESLAILPAAIGLVVAAGGGPLMSARRAAAVGLAIGTACCISLQFAPAALGVLIMLGLRRGGLRTVVAAIAGMVIVPAAILAWLAFRGALPEAWDALVVFNRVYVSRFDVIVSGVPLAVLIASVFAAPLVLGTIVRVATLVARRDGHDLEVAAAAWVVSWVVFIVLQGYLAPHYVIAIAVPMMVLAAGAAAGAARPVERLGVRPTPLALAVCLGLATAVTIDHEADIVRDPLAPSMAEQVRGRTAPGDTVFVWGNQPEIYLEADRVAAGRYVYMIPLTEPGYTTEAQVADLAALWQQHPPAAIIDAAYEPLGPSTLPLLGPWPFDFPQPDDHLDPLRDIVRQQYAVADIIGDWTLYVPADRE